MWGVLPPPSFIKYVGNILLLWANKGKGEKREEGRKERREEEKRKGKKREKKGKREIIIQDCALERARSMLADWNFGILECKDSV